MFKRTTTAFCLAALCFFISSPLTAGAQTAGDPKATSTLLVKLVVGLSVDQQGRSSRALEASRSRRFPSCGFTSSRSRRRLSTACWRCTRPTPRCRASRSTRPGLPRRFPATRSMRINGHCRGSAETMCSAPSRRRAVRRWRCSTRAWTPRIRSSSAKSFPAVGFLSTMRDSIDHSEGA